MFLHLPCAYMHTLRERYTCHIISRFCSWRLAAGNDVLIDLIKDVLHLPASHPLLISMTWSTDWDLSTTLITHLSVFPNKSLWVCVLKLSVFHEGFIHISWSSDVIYFQSVYSTYCQSWSRSQSCHKLLPTVPVLQAQDVNHKNEKDVSAQLPNWIHQQKASLINHSVSASSKFIHNEQKKSV